MYKRHMFCLYPAGEMTFLPCAAAEAVSLSHFEEMAFLYFECEGDLPPRAVLAGEVHPFPDGTEFLELPDVFHYSLPQSRESWQRKVPDKMPWVRINRLKPEMISRYLYFHYQYQEERPGGGPDRYGVIFLYRNYIIHYLEWPFEPEEHPVQGALSTNATPADDEDVWDGIMREFFVQWEDCPFPWHPMTTVTPEGRTILLPANYDKLQKSQH